MQPRTCLLVAFTLSAATTFDIGAPRQIEPRVSLIDPEPVIRQG